MTVKKKNFLFLYLRSMRLYYSCVSGGTVLAGIAAYHGIYGRVWEWRDWVILCCGFFSWGINQIFNDYFDLASDKINAPYRPMASGKLAVKPALWLSTLLMVLLGLVSIIAAPAALPAVICGAALNLLYSKLKHIPLLNCVIYASALSCCAWYGFAGVCGTNWERALSINSFLISALVFPMHFLMCSFSYYKDKEGDKAAGVRTLQNLFPDHITLQLHIVALFGLIFLFLRILDGIVFWLTAVLLLPLAVELITFLALKEYHTATKINCQLCAVWVSCLLGSENLYLFAAAGGVLIAVELLYCLNGCDNKRFVTGFEKLLFYAGMSLRCALKLRSLPALLKAGIFTRIFFCHKLLQLPTGEYKLDFYMPRYPSEAFFTAMSDKLLCHPPRPVSVVCSITKACACRCPHCYQGLDAADELPLDKLCQAARELRSFGVAAWAVEGGEVLLRFERLTALLQELRGLEVWVNSTGFGSTPEKIARLKELEVTGVMSSIHSTIPENHDSFTGVPGSFATALEFLRNCRKAGILTGFNTVLSDEEIISGGIEKIMSLAQEEGCDYVQLIHPKACGRWHSTSFDAPIREEAIRIACAAQKKYNSRACKNAPILTAQVFEESETMLGCTAGAIDRFYIGCSGEVQPCEFVNFSFGNLGQESWSVIYERMRRAFPVPSSEWLCCSCSEMVSEAIRKQGGKTPLPWESTRELIKKLPQGKPTAVYEKMGIYK